MPVAKITMTDKQPPELFATAELPEVNRVRTRGPSPIWIIPFIAVVIASWLAYKTLSEMGPEITVSFHDGTGLEAGKTKVKYKSVDVGLVDTVRISEDLSHVVVTAKLRKDAEPLLQQDSKFWVVRPRISLGGVSGLDALVSGAYIEVEPGKGKPAEKFTGLEAPPVVRADMPGRSFVLRTDRLGSLNDGSPILYRDIKVGEVLGQELSEDSQSVLVHAFIYKPHDQLIKDSTKFWKTGALDVSINDSGINVRMASLSNLITGGVAFYTPETMTDNVVISQAGKEFDLYESFEKISETFDTREMYYVMYFDRSVRGLEVGSSVEFRGIKIGRVTAIGLQFDSKNLDFRIPVTVALQLGRISQTHEVKGANRDHIIKRLVAKGLRARLDSSSLLTGKLFVNLDMYPNTVIRHVQARSEYPQLPTLPSEMDVLKNQANDILSDLRRLPLQQIANELLGTLKGTNRVANSEDLADSIRSFNKASKDLQRLIGNADSSVASVAVSTDQTLVELRKTMVELRKTLGKLDEDSPVMVDLTELMKELTAASQSFRTLTEYLERHPEALVKGKVREKK